MNNITVVGRIFFATSMIASGLLQLIRQDFVRLVPKLPSWVAQPSTWSSVSGALLVGAGVAIALDRKRRPASIMLGVLFLVVFLLYLPGIFANPSAGYVWTNPCKTLALLGGSILLAALPAGPNAKKSNLGNTALNRALQLGVVLFGTFFIVCGVQHFVYAAFVEQMVPAWMPAHGFWTYFTGTALIAGGVGMNFRPTSFAAALLSGLMIFLWVPMLHIPRAMMSPQDAGETSAIFEALALSGTAFLLAGAMAGKGQSGSKAIPS